MKKWFFALVFVLFVLPGVTWSIKNFLKEEMGIKQSSIKKLLKQKESAFLIKNLATIDCCLPGYEKLTLDDIELKLDI